MSFIQLTTPLVLHADPVEPAHAVTKQYVDAKRDNLNAADFTQGVLDANRLPAMQGHVLSNAGSNSVSLSTTGVAEGTYAKVTVDGTGRVLVGSALTNSDVPSVPWEKITTGKPTTADGYGITNAIPLSGGTSSGAIVSTATPAENLHAITKGYVDSLVTGVVSGSLAVGDVIRKPMGVGHVGFLRCNGGYLSKSVYAGLYAVVGDKYEPSEVGPGAGPGAGKPWKNLYAFDTNAETTLGAWTTGALLPNTLYYPQAIVTKNRVYLLGGFTDHSYSSTTYTAPINPDGTLGAWTTGTSLPATIACSQAIVTKNRVYLLGGIIDNSYSSTTYTAPINPDGTLGAWTTATSLPATVGYSQAIVTNNRVYLLGGYSNGSDSSTVYTAPINPDGTLGTWTTSDSLPVAVSYSQAIVTKNRVYLLGGAIDDSYSADVYTAPINPDGTLGAWTTSASLPAAVADSQAIVTKNRVYLLGGTIDDSYSADVYTAPINPDGILGAWTTAGSLPATVASSQTIVTKNRVYLLGGYKDYSDSATYTAPITAGLNDYSAFYNGSYSEVTPDNFRLPNFSELESDGLNYYIKY